MTDLPYTYTEPNGDSLRMFSDGPDLVVTVRQDGGARTVVVPREETPNLVRAVLAAGDTGHLVVSTEENDAVRARGFELTSEVRQLLQQRKDLRRERDAAFEDGARSMRERVAIAATDNTNDDYDIRRQIRALPLFSEGDTTEDQDAQLPDDTAPAPDMWARLKSEIPRLYGRDRAEDLPHDSEYVTALHDVLVAMKRIEHGSPLMAAAGDTEPQDEVPRDTELIQQVRALVKRYGAPWVAYEAARQARH